MLLKIMERFSAQAGRLIDTSRSISSYRLDHSKNSRLSILLAITLCLGLGLYSFYFRTFQVSEHFHLLGDQIRDWDWAVKPFKELPNVGTPTSKGGYCWGPIFYWTLWLIRITVGKHYHNLPHAGGIGLAGIHAAADALLLLAILKKGVPIATALAAMLALASSPFEASLSGTIWNPGLAVSFVELATAAFLIIPNSHSLFRTFLATMLAWLAVQCHTQAIFFALGLMLYLVLDALIDTGVRAALIRLVMIAAVISVLQIPYFADIGKRPDASQEQLSIVSGSFATLVSAPQSIHPYSSFTYLTDSMRELFHFPLGRSLIIIIFGLAIAGIISNYQSHKDILAVSLIPLLLAWIGYSFLLIGMPDTYWFMNLMTPFMLLVVFGCFQSSFVVLRKASPLCGVLLLFLMIAVQPGRLAERAKLVSYPYYGAVVRGAEEIVRNGDAVRSVIPPNFVNKSEPVYLVKWLGGRVDERASLIAIIGEDGRVTYQRIQDEPLK